MVNSLWFDNTTAQIGLHNQRKIVCFHCTSKNGRFVSLSRAKRPRYFKTGKINKKRNFHLLALYHENNGKHKAQQTRQHGGRSVSVFKCFRQETHTEHRHTERAQLPSVSGIERIRTGRPVRAGCGERRMSGTIVRAPPGTSARKAL